MSKSRIPNKARKTTSVPKKSVVASASTEALYGRIRAIWDASRTHVARSVNTAHVCANWLIGREIVEEEQRGVLRAEYGAELIEQLSIRLKEEYGEGFSITALKYMRAFYSTYPELIPIRHAVRAELTWTHHRLILSIENQNARSFYLNECINSRWNKIHG